MTMEQFLGLYNYWVVIFLMMTGFYIVIARENLFKTIIGLNIFQTSVFLLYITMGKVHGGTAPIIQKRVEHGHDEQVHEGAMHSANQFVQTVSFEEDVAGQAVERGAEIVYSNPLPSVLMLTAIVVGIATTALALALVVRIREEYGTIEEDEILELDRNS
jgi:multicomponent Na+:H+ antiporter subunit C